MINQLRSLSLDLSSPFFILHFLVTFLWGIFKPMALVLLVVLLGGLAFLLSSFFGSGSFLRFLILGSVFFWVFFLLVWSFWLVLFDIYTSPSCKRKHGSRPLHRQLLGVNNVKKLEKGENATELIDSQASYLSFFFTAVTTGQASDGASNWTVSVTAP